MKKIFLTAYLAMIPLLVFAQSLDLQATILDEENNEPLIGATLLIRGTNQGSVSDMFGNVVIKNVLVGRHNISISYIGYETIDTIIDITDLSEPLVFRLHSVSEDLEEVTIKATRSTRTIKRIPTRVEFIGSEELEEKAIMNASNISLVLRESTGIQIQQSSLSSGNSSIRIQGLDGRYTQLLKDGFPLFGGFSGGLSIMQIPPLDLQQFEVIKGSSSTLYGGGAIAGLVNMVSKTPSDDAQLDVMLSQTHAGGSTANMFYSQRNSKIGWTMYGSAHYQKAYDPDGDDFSNLPKTYSLSFNPKLFYYPNEQSTFWLGINATFDDRIGGDISLINGRREGIHQYSEDNASQRINAQTVFNTQWDESKSFEIKSSISLFDRTLVTPSYKFDGKETNSFTEVSLRSAVEGLDWIIGANLYSNDFDEKAIDDERDQTDISGGVFSNVTTDFSNKLIGEVGLRIDRAKDWGTFALPRFSLLWKPDDTFSSRIGGGLGYKVPDLFTEEAARLNFQNVLAINKNELVAETSFGLNLDFNYTTVVFDQVIASINQLFYITSISNALLLNTTSDEKYVFSNANDGILSKGAETNVKLSYGDFRWFLNYAFIDTRLTYLPGGPQKPLTPKHNAGSVFMYENESWRIGLEAYYTGSQLLSTGVPTEDFIMMGLLVQKHFPWGSPYVNFENFTDRRQSRFSPETFGTHQQPEFAEIYAPTDGFIFSMGIKVRLLGEDEHH